MNIQKRVLWLVILALSFYAGSISVSALSAETVYIENFTEAAPEPVMSEPEDIVLAGIDHTLQERFWGGIAVNSREMIDKFGVMKDGDIRVDVVVRATTTDAVVVLAVYTNDDYEEDLLVNDWYLDIGTKFNSLRGAISIGTTTAATTTCARGCTFASSTSGFINHGFNATVTETLLKDWYIELDTTSRDGAFDFITTGNATNTSQIGTYFGDVVSGVEIGEKSTPTTTNFILKDGEAIVVTFLPDGASTTDFTTTGNFTGVGTLHLEVTEL